MSAAFWRHLFAELYKSQSMLNLRMNGNGNSTQFQSHYDYVQMRQTLDSGWRPNVSYQTEENTACDVRDTGVSEWGTRRATRRDATRTQTRRRARRTSGPPRRDSSRRLSRSVWALPPGSAAPPPPPRRSPRSSCGASQRSRTYPTITLSNVI